MISFLCKNEGQLVVGLEVLINQIDLTSFPFQQPVLIPQAYLYLEFQQIFQILKLPQTI